MKTKILLVLAILMASCSSDNSSSSASDSNDSENVEKIIAKLEASGDIPVLDRSDSLVGPDLDNNGIRDDIDAYIEQHFELEDQKKAVRQLARVLQSRMDMDIEDRDLVKNSSLKGKLATACIYRKFPMKEGYKPSEVFHSMISMTYNTKGRLKAYLAYDKKLDGTSSSKPRGDVCDENA